MVEAVIGLGSNLGDREAYLGRALSLLRASPGIVLKETSSVYEGPAHVREGSPRQADYLNAVCAIDTSLEPEELLDRCMEIESACGRRRSPGTRWQARTLDLDILLFGNEAVSNPSLTIPHERMADRNFVLVPLKEIRPEAHIPPPINAPVQYLLENCADTGNLHRIAPGSSLLRDEYV